MERMMIRTSANSLVMRAAASRPFRPGMEISIKTTSGRCILTRFKTSRPSFASPRTSTSGNFSSKARMPARTSVWSSANMTRTGLLILFIGVSSGLRRLPLQGEPGMHFSALPGNGREFQPATGQRRTLLHAQQAQTRAAHGLFPHDRHVKSYAVVAYAQVKLFLFGPQIHGHGTGPGVTHHIGQGFLRYAETLGFNHRIQTLIQRLGVEPGLQPDQCGLPFGEPTQGRFQSQIVEDGWAEIDRTS